MADRTPGRWPALWARVAEPEVALLREVVAALVRLIGTSGVTRIAGDADVNAHGVRNLLAGRSRLRHWPGLRLLAYAAEADRSGTVADIAGGDGGTAAVLMSACLAFLVTGERVAL